MMNDKSYEDGVDAASVSEMVESMSKCITGRSKYVKMPVPLNHIGPSRYFEFIDSDDSYPADLNPRPLNTSGSSSVSANIASRARFKIRDAELIENIETTSRNRVVSMKVDDAIAMYSNIGSSQYEESLSNRARTKTVSSNNLQDSESSESEMEDMDEAVVIPKSSIKKKSSKASSIGKSISPSTKDKEIRIGGPASRFRH